MSKFELNYKQSIDYENRVELTISVNKRPSQEAYKDLLDAIDVIDKFAQVYVPIPPKPNTKQQPREEN